MVKRLRNVVGWFGASVTSLMLALGVMSATPQRGEAAAPWWCLLCGGVVVVVVGAKTVAEVIGANDPPPCPPASPAGTGCENPGGPCPHIPQTCGGTVNGGCSC